MRLNHVGISVPNFQETVNHYEKVMGFRVSHRFAPNPDGRPGTAFVQISRDTFIEIAPAAADAKPSVTHIGFGVDDIKANITDPAGIRTELNEQPPGSLMRQSIDSWK